MGATWSPRRLVAGVERRLHEQLWQRAPLEWTLRSGLQVRVESLADWIVYNEIFVDEEYDAPLRAALAAASRQGRLNVLDIGANVGFFSLRLVDLLLRDSQREGAAAPALRAVLVEGSPAVHATLSERLALNTRLMPGVAAHHGLAGRRDGAATMFQHHFHAANSVNNPVMQQHGRGVSVPFLDIETLCAGMPRIDLMKCDIEGSEQVFLEHYPALLARVDAAVFELHPQLCDVPRCRALLAEAGLQPAGVLREQTDQSVEVFRRV
jgi:FkbM family methyltransferase